MEGLASFYISAVCLTFFYTLCWLVCYNTSWSFGDSCFTTCVTIFSLFYFFLYGLYVLQFLRLFSALNGLGVVLSWAWSSRPIYEELRNTAGAPAELSGVLTCSFGVTFFLLSMSIFATSLLTAGRGANMSYYAKTN